MISKRADVADTRLSEIQNTNRVLLILRVMECDGLTLSIEGDKIRPSRPPRDDERAFIAEHRELIMSLIPQMSFLTKKECRPHLKMWYEDREKGWGKKWKTRKK